jgi:hypothetical protein
MRTNRSGHVQVLVLYPWCSLCTITQMYMRHKYVQHSYQIKFNQMHTMLRNKGIVTLVALVAFALVWTLPGVHDYALIGTVCPRSFLQVNASATRVATHVF